jgi:hypothetical protein
MHDLWCEANPFEDDCLFDDHVQQCSLLVVREVGPRLESRGSVLCRLHVHIRLCQPELSGHRALVSCAHQLLDAASLTGGVRLPHVGEELADVGRGTSRIGGRLPRFGVRFTSVGYHLAQIGLGATRVGHDLAHIGTRCSFVRSRIARVRIRVARIGDPRARVGRSVPALATGAVRVGVGRALLLAASFFDARVPQFSMRPFGLGQAPGVPAEVQAHDDARHRKPTRKDVGPS